jgi:hypothetical protein
MTQELLYSGGDLRFAVAIAKTEIERLTEVAATTELILKAVNETVERLTAENTKLAQSAERVRVYKQRCLEAIAERDSLAKLLRMLLKLHITTHNATEHSLARKCLYEIYGETK